MVDRQAKVAAYNKKQQSTGRTKGVVLGTSAVVLVLVIALVAFLVTRGGSGSSSASSTAIDAGQQIMPATVTGSTTVQTTPKQVANTTGVKGVLAWDTSGYPASGTATSGTVDHTHVTGPVKYAVTPPIGGQHNAIWMNAGVYTKPLPNERAVHNLEHGAVWITYRPNLPAAQVKKLLAFVGKQSLIAESGEDMPSGQSNRYVDMSPWSSNDLPSPIVISAWGYQLRVSSPTDPRLQQFVNTFRHNEKYTPEYGAAVDGVPVQTGGRAAAYGSTKANPSGSV